MTSKSGGKIIRGPRNNWWFLIEMLKGHGYEFVVRGEKAKIVPSDRVRTTALDPNRKRFVLRGTVDPKNNVFPILDFSSTSTLPFLSPGIGYYISGDIHDSQDISKDADVAVGSATAIEQGPSRNVGQLTQNSSATGSLIRDANVMGLLADPPSIVQLTAGAAQPAKAKKSEGRPVTAAQTYPGNPHRKQVQEAMLSEFQGKKSISGINASVTTLGIPSLQPGDAVNLSGFLPRNQISLTSDAVGIYDGDYGVMEVIHSASEAGFSTRFEAICDVFPSRMTELMSAQQSLPTGEEKGAGEGEGTEAGSKSGGKVVEPTSEEAII